MRSGDPVKMKKVDTGLKRVEKAVIREMPGEEKVEVVIEKTVKGGILEIKTVEVVRGKKVWRVIMKTEEVTPEMRQVTGVTMMTRVIEKFQAPPLI